MLAPKEPAIPLRADVDRPIANVDVEILPPKAAEPAFDVIGIFRLAIAKPVSQ
jgi:hypothetical protein